MDYIVIPVLVVFCSKCQNVLDVLLDENEPSYTDKNCKCGSIGYYTQEISVRIKCLIEKPIGKEAFFEEDGNSYYKGDS